MCECNCKIVSSIFIAIWSLVALLTSILVAVSFSTLELNQAGLKFDTINYSLEKSSIYLPGRHWVGLGSVFKTFPTCFQSIHFLSSQSPGYGEIVARTSDYVQIILEVSVTYKLRLEFLQALYALFPDMNYEPAFAKISKNSVVAIAQRFSLDDFFAKRKEICDEMSNSINIEYRNVFAELIFFQLYEITLDKSIETSLVNRMVSKNESVMKTTYSNIKATEGEIETLRGKNQVNTGTIISKAKKDAEILRSKGKSENMSALIDSHSQVFKQFMSGLNFKGSEVAKLIYYKKIDDNTFFGGLFEHETNEKYSVGIDTMIIK